MKVEEQREEKREIERVIERVNEREKEGVRDRERENNKEALEFVSIDLLGCTAVCMIHDPQTIAPFNFSH